jgi:hypothetical protein
MAGLDPAIHVFDAQRKQDVDARPKAGHDEAKISSSRFPKGSQRSSAVRSANDVISSFAVADPEK